MRLISGILFVLIQLTLMGLQLLAAVVGAMMGAVTLVSLIIWKVLKFVMPKLYTWAIEWRFK